MAITPNANQCDINFDSAINNVDGSLCLAHVGHTVSTNTINGVDFVVDVNQDGAIRLQDLSYILAIAALPTVQQRRSWFQRRHPYLQPFAVDSIWNMPIGASATRQDCNFPAPDTTFYEDDVIIMEPNYSLTPVYRASNWQNAWNGSSRCTTTTTQMGPTVGGVPTGVPLRSDTVCPDVNGADGGTPNHSAAILLADRRTVYQTQPLTHCNSGAWTTAFDFYTADIWGHGMFGAHGASDLSSLGGTIRLHELRPGGVIKHALKIELDADQLYYNASSFGAFAKGPGYRWPAKATDDGAPNDYHGTNPNITMGSLLALPANFNVSSLTTEPARIIATALVKYGAYVVDTGGDASNHFRCYYFATERSGSTPHAAPPYMVTAPPGPRVVDNFEIDWPLLGSYEATSGDWFDDIAAIVAALQVITDSGPGTYTGTATSVTANSMFDATNDWWQYFNLASGTLTMGGRTATLTASSGNQGVVNFTGGWDGATPAAGAYTLTFSGYAIGGAGTRLAPLAPSIGTGPA